MYEYMRGAWILVNPIGDSWGFWPQGQSNNRKIENDKNGVRSICRLSPSARVTLAFGHYRRDDRRAESESAVFGASRPACLAVSGREVVSPEDAPSGLVDIVFEHNDTCFFVDTLISERENSSSRGRWNQGYPSTEQDGNYRHRDSVDQLGRQEAPE
jgi:hypothetical protein